MAKKAPAKVNNFKVNKPTIAKSRNIQPLLYIKKREVEEVKPVVNGKVADEKLIHKPGKVVIEFNPPVITKGVKNGPKQNSRRGTRTAKNKGGPSSPRRE